MTHEEAVNDLNVIKEFFEQESGAYPVSLEYAIKVLKNELSADRPQEWIPCSERLPTNDDGVIISILDETGDTPYRYSDFGWYLEAAKCWIVESEKRTDVVAWMPLPKPWKGADDVNG